MTFQAPRMTPVESDAWLSLITVSELLTVALDTQLRENDLTHVEFRVLSVLMRATGKARMGEVAAGLTSNLPRVSKVITRMVARGLVERQSVAGDKRAVDVVLTQAGRKAFMRALPGHLEYIRELFLNQLSEEQQRDLAAILRPVKDRLDPHCEVR